MSAKDDVVLSDDNLEGDCGSDFGDGAAFPSDWTVLDDADEDGDMAEMTVVEEVGEEDDNDLMIVEEKTVIPAKKPAPKTANVKTGPKTAQKNLNSKTAAVPKVAESKPKGKADDKPAAAPKTSAKPVVNSPEKKTSVEKKPAAVKKTAAEKKPAAVKKEVNEKTTEDDLESIEGDMGDEDVETFKSAKPAVKSTKQSPARSGAPPQKNTSAKTQSSPKADVPKSVGSGAKKTVSTPPKQTTPSKKVTESPKKVKEDDKTEDGNTNKKAEAEEAAKKREIQREKAKEVIAEVFSSNVIQLMTERTNDLTAKLRMALGDLEISDLDSKEKSWERTAKWFVKVSPVDHVDLADMGIKKAMNISQGSAFFYIGKGNKREGQMMFLFNQYKDAQLIVNKLACIPFKSEVVNVVLKRKKSKTNINPEVGELSIYSKSATSLTVPIRGKEVREGNPINRRLLLRNVPVGTSREMIEVMVPYTLSVKFQALKAGETAGIATMECSSPAVARTVKKCYVSIKLGSHDVVVQKEGPDEEEGKGKNTAKPRPANSFASSQRDSSSQRERSRSDSRTGRNNDRSVASRDHIDRRDTMNINRSGRKVDAKVSLRQEQAKKIRDRSRQYLTQSRTIQNRPNMPMQKRPIQRRPMPNQANPTPNEVIRRSIQERAMQKMKEQQQQQVAMQQQQQQHMQMVRQQQIAQAVQQNHMAIASFQAQTQAKMPMMEGTGDGLLGPIPVGGVQNVQQNVPSHIQMMPEMNTSMLAQQERERERVRSGSSLNRAKVENMGRNMDSMRRNSMERVERDNFDNMGRNEMQRGGRNSLEGMGRNNMDMRRGSMEMGRSNRAQLNDSYGQQNEPVRGDKYGQENQYRSGMDSGFNRPQMNQSEPLSNRGGMRNESARIETNRATGAWSQRSSRAPESNVSSRVASRSPARGQDTHNQGQAARGQDTYNRGQAARGQDTYNRGQAARGQDTYNRGQAARGQDTYNRGQRQSFQDQRLEESQQELGSSWGQGNDDVQVNPRDVYAVADRRTETDRRGGGETAWTDNYAQDVPYGRGNEESYGAAGMKRSGRVMGDVPVLEKRQRMDQERMSDMRDDNYQLQEMDWSKEAAGVSERSGYDKRVQSWNWGSGANEPVDEVTSDPHSFKVHDYGHQSQGNGMYDQSITDSSWNNTPGMMQNTGMLNKSQQRQQNYNQRPQNQQRSQNQQRTQTQQRLQNQQRSQNQRLQNQQRSQNQQRQQNQQQRGQGQQDMMQQQRMQEQMMQATGRFQPKMVLLPTRLLPGMKRN